MFMLFVLILFSLISFLDLFLHISLLTVEDASKEAHESHTQEV
jgi:hypothetical protein